MHPHKPRIGSLPYTRHQQANQYPQPSTEAIQRTVAHITRDLCFSHHGTVRSIFAVFPQLQDCTENLTAINNITRLERSEWRQTRRAATVPDTELNHQAGQALRPTQIVFSDSEDDSSDCICIDSDSESEDAPPNQAFQKPTHTKHSRPARPDKPCPLPKPTGKNLKGVNHEGGPSHLLAPPQEPYKPYKTPDPTATTRPLPLLPTTARARKARFKVSAIRNQPAITRFFRPVSDPPQHRPKCYDTAPPPSPRHGKGPL